MLFKLAIIGPEDLVKKSKEICSSYSELKALPAIYQSEIQAIDLVSEYEQEVDGFLFTGFLPYYQTELSRVTKKPLFYFPLSGTSLYRTLFNMRVKHQIDIERISIDTITEHETSETYRELELAQEKIYINPLSLKDYNQDQYISFHEELFKKGATTAAVTAVNSVYNRLTHKGIPSYKIIPTMYAMKGTFDSIKSFVETQKAKNNQIIVQVLEVKSYNQDNRVLTNYDKKEKKLVLYQKLIKYAKEYYACVFPTEDDEFVVFITQGIFQKYTNFFERIPVLRQIEEELGLEVGMGIGMGANALEAEQNARKAMKLANEKKGSCAFVIRQDGEVLGPIGTPGQMEYRLKSSDNKLVKIAEKTNLSIATLTQVADIIEKLSRDSLTANDIQEGLGVTLRTANRIMTRLYDTGIAEKNGFEQPVSRGRPRQIYKVKL